jgi:hypothetical protein
VLPPLNRRTVLAALGAAVWPLPALSTEAWLSKPPAQWTENEWRKLMNDSPWARGVRVALDGPSVGSIGGDIPAVNGACCSLKRAKKDEGAPDVIPAPTTQALIRWQSARPIKLGILRARLGAEAIHSAQARQFVEREETDYVVAVLLPRANATPSAAIEALKKNVSLSRPGFDKLYPLAVVPPTETNIAYVFHFSKAPPITLADKEVEFSMRLGALEIKHKFKLKELVFQDRLEL